MALQGSHDPVGAEGSGADGRKPDLRSWKVARSSFIARWGCERCTLNPVCQRGGPIRQAMETSACWVEANRLRRSESEVKFIKAQGCVREFGREPELLSLRTEACQEDLIYNGEFDPGSG